MADMTLTALDRCDQCSAQAYVVVTTKPTLDSACDGPHAKGTLMFCAHHYTTHESVLTTSGAVVLLDNRKALQHV